VVFSAVGFVVDLGPGATSNTLFAKQMDGVTQIFIASPALMALAMFAGTLGHGRSAGEALENLRITLEAFSIITNLG
jgi:hypothetical protein